MALIDELHIHERELEIEKNELTATFNEHRKNGTNDSAKARLVAENLEKVKDDLMVARQAIVEQEEKDARFANYEAYHREMNSPGVVTRESNPVYRPDNSTGASFFRDLFHAGQPNGESARARLADSQQRALTTGAGAGGEFAPPDWLVSDFIALSRAGRVTADAVAHLDLPTGVSSINIPKVASGTSTAVQATQNTGVSDTDLTTDSVSSGITTIAGQQVVSRQLLDQSGIPLDQIILGDLARDYAVKFDKQVLSGTGASGQLRGILGTGTGVTGSNSIVYTSSAPKVTSSTNADSFAYQMEQAGLQIATKRFLPATVAIMHPRRWSWIRSALDSTGRPIVALEASPFNVVGFANADAAQGIAGTFAGLTVLLDPNIPTNLGTGTDEDRVIVMRASDLWLWESPSESRSFEAPYADSLGVLFRVHAYSAFIPDRLPEAISVISGTGLVAP